MRSRKNVVQRLPRYHLDDAPEDVGGQTVVPAGAGVVDQGKGRDDLDALLEIRSPAPVEGVEAAPVQRIDRRVAEDAVGEAGRVGQQVADQDRARRRAEVPVVVHLHVGEGRDDAGKRIVQREAPFLDEDHRGDARDRLGHRVDAEDVVGLEGVLVLDAPAVGVPVYDLAAAGDQRHDAGRAFVVDELLHGRADAREDLAGEADLLGGGGGEVLGGLRVRVQREGPDARRPATGDQPGRDGNVLRAVHLVGDRRSRCRARCSPTRAPRRCGRRARPAAHPCPRTPGRRRWPWFPRDRRGPRSATSRRSPPDPTPEARCSAPGARGVPAAGRRCRGRSPCSRSPPGSRSPLPSRSSSCCWWRGGRQARCAGSTTWAASCGRRADPGPGRRPSRSCRSGLRASPPDGPLRGRPRWPR